ncbi:hypothetical protein [Sphingomonas sp. Leaf339]|uniref:hypothetical protein n=1 Tax=Sphingomonas sp. Leaf339 TaxID=1736343 RepID=UPI0006F96117|nr:hypothetical protein [Sphingomonas sp. Leaf339]
MRQLTLLASALLLSACGDVVDERYGTWLEAKQAGAVKRGWVPPFVPATARNLRSRHDVDTNSQRLTFRLPPRAVQPMIDDIAPLSRVNGEMLQRAINEVGGGIGAGTKNAAYMMCTDKFSAVIVVELDTGDVAYQSPAEWGRANCPRPL